jgi:hypothetical protein
MKQFHTEDLQILGATVQNLVATATWRTGFVRPCASPYSPLLPFVSFRKQGLPINCVESFCFRVYKIPAQSPSLHSVTCVVCFITKMLSVVRFLFTKPDWELHRVLLLLNLLLSLPDKIERKFLCDCQVPLIPNGESIGLTRLRTFLFFP